MINEELFCKLMSDYFTEEIKSINQIAYRRFTGQELFDLINYIMEETDDSGDYK